MFKAPLTVFAVLLSGTLIVATLHAMEIQKFDKMVIEDQGDYFALLLVGAQRVLIDEGKGDLAAKVDKIFTEIRPGDETPLGLIEFQENLARARVVDAERHAKDHSAPRLEAEHAMILTLKKNSIILPKSFMTVGKDFKPKHPPKEKK